MHSFKTEGFCWKTFGTSIEKLENFTMHAATPPILLNRRRTAAADQNRLAAADTIMSAQASS